MLILSHVCAYLKLSDLELRMRYHSSVNAFNKHPGGYLIQKEPYDLAAWKALSQRDTVVTHSRQINQDIHTR